MLPQPPVYPLWAVASGVVVLRHLLGRRTVGIPPEPESNNLGHRQQELRSPRRQLFVRGRGPHLVSLDPLHPIA